MITKDQNILGDMEVLDNVAKYIYRSHGGQDLDRAIEDVSGYLGAGVGWQEQEVVGYLRERVRRMGL